MEYGWEKRAGNFSIAIQISYSRRIEVFTQPAVGSIRKTKLNRLMFVKGIHSAFVHVYRLVTVLYDSRTNNLDKCDETGLVKCIEDKRSAISVAGKNEIRKYQLECQLILGKIPKFRKSAIFQGLK